MFANFATAIPTGAAVTFMLLFAMQSLIAMQPGLGIDTTVPPKMIFLSKIPPDTLAVNDFEPLDLPPVVPSPAIDTPRQPNPTGGGTSIPISPPVPTGPQGTLDNPFTNDGPLMAIVRVEPHYPAVAQSRGLEGFVVVQFDVLADGTVGNIAVIDSSSSVFERSAMQAASRFRFKASVVDGVPQTSTGVRYQFRFRMDK